MATRRTTAEFFDPQAPGVRGWIGIVAGSLQIIWGWFTGRFEGVTRYFDSMSPRARGIVMITVAVAMLLGVGALIAGWYAEFTADPIPVLADALVAPYNIDMRYIPPGTASAEAIRPPSFGTFTFVSEDIPDDSRRLGLLNQCLLALEPEDEKQEPCDLSYRMTGVAYGKYMSGDRSVHLSIQHYANETQASANTLSLFRYARSIGQTGDFTLGGVGEVDYFYSYSDGWVAFTWARGPWVLSLSSRSYSTFQESLEVFPY
ncbi:MAG: hypothetical protein JW966_13215 [Anaerolineae bacterium]|nr:hypothetical protein [Anaerolineae bacterium]